jgi:hypoxanthine phosphoribosyltransferase
VTAGAAAPAFTHAAEREVAEILDGYGVAWEYEPREFVLARDASGRTTDAFRPDFWLPEAGLWLEVTMARNCHLGPKHRKVRRFREAFPDEPLILLDRYDVERILAGAGRGDRYAALRGAAGQLV